MNELSNTNYYYHPGHHYPDYHTRNTGDCFSQCPTYDVNELGPVLSTTCQLLPTVILFMSLLDKYLRRQCDIMDPCGRVKSLNEKFNHNYDKLNNYLNNKNYSFIVVGGGSAGNVVAARLAEIHHWNVLLIEAGHDEPPGATIPSMIASFWGDQYGMDWNYYTEPQENACLGNPEKRCYWPRGKVLGGTGVINGMMFLRGNEHDYNLWEQLINDPDGYLWNWKNVIPYFRKLESNQQMKELNLDPQYHGTSGPITVSQFPYQPPFAHDILAAAKQQGLPVSDDLNDPKRLIGFAITQTNNRNGTRLSSARAYLRPHYKKPNLDILLNTTVLKLLIDETTKSAYGLQYQINNEEKVYEIKNNVENEIILSSGTLNSPKILLASGVGPKNDLKEAGVKPIHDLPGVGQNLLNHVAYGLKFLLKNLTEINHLNYATVMEYLFERNGPLSSSGMAQLTGIFPSKYTNKTYPDLQLFFGGFYASCGDGSIEQVEKECEGQESKPKSVEFFSISVVNLHPKSKGYLKLAAGKDYLTKPPAMQPKYFSEVDDINVIIDGINLVLNNLTKAQILQDKYKIHFIEPTMPSGCESLTKFSDEYWTCAIRHDTGPENHQVGTCKMGSKKDKMSVVSAKLSVHGLKNVRVIDGSVMPYIPSSNTQAPIFMIGEKGADFIKEFWLGKWMEQRHRGFYPWNNPSWNDASWNHNHYPGSSSWGPRGPHGPHGPNGGRGPYGPHRHW